MARPDLFALPLKLDEDEDLWDSVFEEKVAFVGGNQDTVMLFLHSLSDEVLNNAEKMAFMDIILNAGFKIDLLYDDYDFGVQLEELIHLINNNIPLFNDVYNNR
jgi:hypothetical protein